MRLPLMDDGQTVNEVETEKLLMKAYKNGVNYFDTAWPYHGGQSERVVGKIMKQLPGMRGKRRGMNPFANLPGRRGGFPF